MKQTLQWSDSSARNTNTAFWKTANRNRRVEMTPDITLKNHWTRARLQSHRRVVGSLGLGCGPSRRRVGCLGRPISCLYRLRRRLDLLRLAVLCRLRYRSINNLEFSVRISERLMVLLTQSWISSEAWDFRMIRGTLLSLKVLGVI